MFKHIFATIALTICITAVYSQDVVANFIKEHPDKSSIYFVHNGKVIADKNSDRAMPLASTVKIIVAIEYAEQAAMGKIDTKSLIDTADLHRYYIPNTDGGAQPGWIKLLTTTNKLQDGKVSLEEVAKGMINFSSNANTEYLLDLLGLDNVNKQIEKLKLSSHSQLYYFISALSVIADKTKEQLEALSTEEYIKLANQAHIELKQNGAKTVNTQMLSLDKQYIWSSRLTKASTKDYASIMQKINSRQYFTPEAQKHLDIIMEGILQNPANRSWLKHAGMKGGSTVWVLTKALYATKTDGETIELAYFFNDLTLAEQNKLQRDMNKFELGILTNKDGARDKIVGILNQN